MIQQTNGAYRVTARRPLADGVMILLFTAGFFLLFTRLSDVPAWVFIAVGLACLVAGVLMLTVFKFSKFVAEVNEEGIVERVSKVSKGLIRWEEIADIYLYEAGIPQVAQINKLVEKKDLLVGISLVDTDAYTQKLNIIQKGLIKTGLSMGYAPVNIPGNLLGDDVEEFVELCKSLAEKRRGDMRSEN